MTSFFRRILGVSAPDKPTRPVRNARVADRYFALAGQIKDAKRRGEFERVAVLTRETTPLFAGFVAESKREYGRWDIRSSVAVDDGAPILMALGDHAGLKEMREALSAVSELSDWAASVADRAAQAQVGDRLIALLRDAGPLLQTEAKVRLNVSEGRDFSQLCSWLEKVGRVEREKRGKSYLLSAAGA